MKTLHPSHSVVLMEDQADRNASPVQATYRRQDQGLRARFQLAPIIAGVVVIIAVITLIMIALQGEGVTIDSFLKGTKTDEQIKKLLDHYNSVTGTISMFVTKPIDFFLGMFMATAFLCLATKFTLGKTSAAAHWNYLPVLAVLGLAFLFGNGLGSLNVQVTPGSLTTVIADEDLAVSQSVVNDQPLRIDRSISTAWDKAYLETASGNSVFNTILRTNLLPQEAVQPYCSWAFAEEVKAPITAVPLVEFGFKSQPWQSEILKTAVTPAASLKIPLNIKGVSQLPADAKLPSPGNVTSNLEMILASFLNTLPVGYREEFWKAYDYNSASKNNRLADTKYKWPSGASPDTRSYLNVSLGLWKEMLNGTFNASTALASVEYNRIPLSESMTFDSVTIELPVKKILMSVSGYGEPQATDKDYSLTINEQCSREGCVTPKDTFSVDNAITTLQPRVQVASICVNDDGTEDLTNYSCNRKSNSSMLVVSLGIRIDGDTWDKSDELAAVTPTNLRTVYSLTVGRLSWKNEDLAAAFGAQCGSKTSDCSGVRFKMQADSDKSDYLVVGKNSLPLSELSSFNLDRSKNTKWRSLVSVGDGLGQRGFELLLPRHFSKVTADGLTLQKPPLVTSCNTFAEDFINTVERNHLYMATSLQTSYTAAFYYLFQNAVQRKSLSTSVASQPQLEFAGNRQDMNVQVSIPTVNAVVSLTACVLLLLATFGIICKARNSERLVSEYANAAIVTEAMVNSGKYPPLMVKMGLEERDAINDGASPDDSWPQVPLQELRVQSVILENIEESDRRSFHIGSEIEV